MYKIKEREHLEGFEKERERDKGSELKGGEKGRNG